MSTQDEDHRLTGTLWGTIVSLVRSDGPDLTTRQLSVFLTIYLTKGPHTVRGLAVVLNVSKPAITRALDRLGELDLAHRAVEPGDRRGVIAMPTAKGTNFLGDLRRMVVHAEQATHHLTSPADLL